MSEVSFTGAGPAPHRGGHRATGLTGTSLGSTPLVGNANRSAPRGKQVSNRSARRPLRQPASGRSRYRFEEAAAAATVVVSAGRAPVDQSCGSAAYITP